MIAESAFNSASTKLAWRKQRTTSGKKPPTRSTCDCWRSGRNRLRIRLANNCHHQLDVGHVEAAERALLLVEELASMDPDEEHRGMAIELRFNYSLA